MNDPLRFRQVHLDFHTHGSIEGVGTDFNPAEFAETLSKAHVDSINIFAHCHHGYLYYESKKFPDRVHPALRRNLLGEQIAACHAKNILAPIYISVQWDALIAEQHPEWLVRSPEGKVPIGAYDAGFYNTICLNTPYVDFLKEMVDEIFTMLPVDGFWFDILLPIDCSCVTCKRMMVEQGLDPEKAEVRRQFGFDTLTRFKKVMTEHIRKIQANCRIFYNSGHVGPVLRRELDYFSHLELESLPSGQWGYTHFPATVRYARTLGHDFLGMTGKFHTAWGDFHSFKNPEALQFECFNMLANNAKCCIGDQLHPKGKIDLVTYDLIGNVFKEVEAREAWCSDAVAVTDIGVMSPEEFASGGEFSSLPKVILGATRMLQELHHQFDVIDSQADISGYKVLILPDEIPVDEKLGKKLNDYIAKGGKMIVTHRSGLDPVTNEFRLPVGVKYEGKSDFAPIFVKPHATLAKGLRETEYVIYQGGSKVVADSGTEVLADAVEPYFNRTWKHYCSHLHAPSSGKIEGPAITQKDGVIYFAQPLFGQYENNAPQWCRTFLRNALERLLPNPVLKTNGPTTLIATVNAQKKEKRANVHLLHYIPVRSSGTIDILDETIPLHDVTLSLRADQPVKSVTLVPEGKALKFGQENGRVDFTVPYLKGYQIVELAVE